MDGGPQAERGRPGRAGGSPRRVGLPQRGWPGLDDDWEPPWAQARWNRPESRRRRRTHGRVVFPILLFVIEAAGAHWAAQNEHSIRPLDHVGYALIAVGCVALIWRLRWRMPMLIVTIGSIVAYVIVGYPYGPVFLASFVSIIGALRARHRYGTWITLAVGYTLYVALGRIFPTIGGMPIAKPSVPTAILVAAWIIVVCAVGEGIRNRTERMVEISRMHAEQQRTRTEQKRRQESEERLRIAQELHDVLGHHLSLINVQAGVGLHLMDDDPAQARTSLQTIKQASAEALGEVRAVLGMLRDKDERAPRAPAPGLADLRTLIDSDHTIIEGTPHPLPPDVDRAAFRITQESLTNVRRHAGEHATAWVLIAYEPDGLRLEISDDGVGPDSEAAPARPAGAAPGEVAPPATASSAGASAPAAGSTATSDAAPEPGSGIVGMRTRAEALDGTLTTGPGPDGGFRVVAKLPLPQARTQTSPAPAGEPGEDR